MLPENLRRHPRKKLPFVGEKISEEKYQGDFESKFTGKFAAINVRNEDATARIVAKRRSDAHWRRILTAFSTYKNRAQSSF